MADPMPTPTQALGSAPEDPEDPDIMNDPNYDPASDDPRTRRRSTTTSKPDSASSDTSGPTCRICRSEGSTEEPLFYPCKCSGSIKFVHQECLMEWLAHSHKKHCELCKTPFRFTKLYDANMPSTLPWRVFAKRACIHMVKTTGWVLRMCLVGLVWLGLIPWVVRWVWRWFFWMADAAWARDAFMDMVRREALKGENETPGGDWLANTFTQFLTSSRDVEGPTAYNIAHSVAESLGLAGANATTWQPNPVSWPRADPSMLSSWSYVASLTSSPNINRFALDIFEGQLITCVVIVGFILVFLIREWVVQQQPLINMEGLGNVQVHIQEAADRMQEDNARLRRQEEVLDLARARLGELQDARARADREEEEEEEEPNPSAEFMGFDALEGFINHATASLRNGDLDAFHHTAVTVTKQIRSAGRSGMDNDEITEKVHEKLATLPDEDRKEWEKILISEAHRLRPLATDESRRGGPSFQEGSSRRPQNPPPRPVQTRSWNDDRRPAMSEHDFQSRPNHIQRLLEDFESEDAEEANAPKAGAQSSSTIAQDKEPLPITNAGPDAKINIKRSGNGNLRVVPEPRSLSPDEVEKRRLEDEVEREMEDESRHTSDEEGRFGASGSSSERDGSETSNDNPFHPDGPAPDRRDEESFGNRVASAFREEFGLDEAEELAEMQQAQARFAPERRAADTANANEDTARPPRPAEPPQGFMHALANWFWGDIHPLPGQEPAPPANEERENAGPGQEQNDPAGPARPPDTDQIDHAEAPAGPNQEQQEQIPAAGAQAQEADQEAEAAEEARRAGLDAEAIEDAEDLEGVMELLGLQGPIIGLIQTSAFCTVLVGATIVAAVVMPYAWGKIVLSFIGNPVSYLIKMPLQITSWVADTVADLVLLFGGWLVMLCMIGLDSAISGAQAWLPWLGGQQAISAVLRYATKTAGNSGARLEHMFIATHEPADGLAWSWGFLAGSVRAHASLKNIQGEMTAVLDISGNAVTFVVDAISSGTLLESCWRGLPSLDNISEMQNWAHAALAFAKDSSDPFFAFLGGLRKGSLTFSTSSVPLDPALIYWSTTDRFLAILSGYASLAAIAAFYVAIDTSITTSESGQRTEKMIRDTLRQAGGVLKVILIISIEMLVFPLYCGLLLDIAFLPLFQDASVSTRWAFAGNNPYLFCFVHWFVGTCYMFHFALFVGMCRKILRRGVLWFIRDPDDPTFHPVRDVLERNVATQLRKIAFSALVYGALVILCLGGVIWTIGKVFDGVFPICWISTEPVLEFPTDLVLYNLAAPLVIRLYRPSHAVDAVYGWWLRRCARSLRLSHFLFGDRKKDEEGEATCQTWMSLFKAPFTRSSDEALARDGKYILTPSSDQYRPPKKGEAFLHTTDDDVFVADREGRPHEHFAKIYIPPFFRLRITLFMVCLWMFSAFVGLCSTLVPLVFGRRVLARVLPDHVGVSDIYAYSLGAYVLGGALLAATKGRRSFDDLKEKVRGIDVKAWVRPVLRFVFRAAKCAYVYGFLGLVLPITFALVLQFYLVLPLHTWATASAAAKAASAPSASIDGTCLATDAPYSLFANPQTPFDALRSSRTPTLANHTIHILQDYALGLLYVRIAARLVLTAPTSRITEAFRLIVARGYLNPEPRLATRYIILPFILAATAILTFPPLLVKAALAAVPASSLSWCSGALAIESSAEATAKAYRYCYPLAMACVGGVTSLMWLGRATGRWRARIRDEVYLVGERLHNFGEVRPPAGAKMGNRRMVL